VPQDLQMVETTVAEVEVGVMVVDTVSPQLFRRTLRRQREVDQAETEEAEVPVASPMEQAVRPRRLMAPTAAHHLALAAHHLPLAAHHLPLVEGAKQAMMEITIALCMPRCGSFTRFVFSRCYIWAATNLDMYLL
jgi:hypothetical protein